MPKWYPPYSYHNFTTEEFLKLKADYIAKHGYTVYLPGWSDIVHVELENGFTEAEEIAWHEKDWKAFTPERLSYLQGIKERRRRDYLRLLGSPQPNILKNRGTILTALDDNQDALSTLTFLFQIMYSVLPLAISTWLTGPVGWMMRGSDILNLCTMIMSPERSAIRQKRIKDSVTDKNPFSKKARGRNRIRLYKGKISGGAGFEVMQTSDMLFGYGITLGALMNLPLDLYYARARTIEGAEVRIETPMEAPSFWKNQASSAWKSLCTIFTTKEIFNYTQASSMLILSHLSAIAMHILAPTLDPKNNILDVELYASKALEPKKSYLREIMEENGDDPDGFTGWPLTGETYASCTRLHIEGAPIATKNFQDYCSDNRYNLEAFYCAQRAVDAGFFMLAAATGDDAIEYDYIAHEKITHSLLNSGYRFPWYMNSKLTLNPNPATYRGDNKQIDLFTPRFLDPTNRVYDINDIDESYRTYRERRGFPPFFKDQVDGLNSLAEKFNWVGVFGGSYIGILSGSLRFTTIEITKYLDSYEQEGLVPSTPDFIRYCKENFGINFPVNETPSETELPQE